MEQGSMKPELLRQLQKAVNNACDEQKPILQEFLDVVVRNVDRLDESDILQLLKNFCEFKTVSPDDQRRYFDDERHSSIFTLD